MEQEFHSLSTRTRIIPTIDLGVSLRYDPRLTRMYTNFKSIRERVEFMRIDWSKWKIDDNETPLSTSKTNEDIPKVKDSQVHLDVPSDGMQKQCSNLKPLNFGKVNNAGFVASNSTATCQGNTRPTDNVMVGKTIGNNQAGDNSNVAVLRCDTFTGHLTDSTAISDAPAASEGSRRNMFGSAKPSDPRLSRARAKSYSYEKPQQLVYSGPSEALLVSCKNQIATPGRKKITLEEYKRCKRNQTNPPTSSLDKESGPREKDNGPFGNDSTPFDKGSIPFVNGFFYGTTHEDYNEHTHPASQQDSSIIRNRSCFNADHRNTTQIDTNMQMETGDEADRQTDTFNSTSSVHKDDGLDFHGEVTFPEYGTDNMDVQQGSSSTNIETHYTYDDNDIICQSPCPTPAPGALMLLDANTGATAGDKDHVRRSIERAIECSKVFAHRRRSSADEQLFADKGILEINYDKVWNSKRGRLEKFTPRSRYARRASYCPYERPQSARSHNGSRSIRSAGNSPVTKDQFEREQSSRKRVVRKLFDEANTGPCNGQNADTAYVTHWK